MSQDKLGKIGSQINLLSYFNNNLTVLYITTWPYATICRNTITIWSCCEGYCQDRSILLRKKLSEQSLKITKWVIRSCKSNDRQYNGQEKKNKNTMIYKAQDRKLKIEVNRGPPKGLAGPASLLAPVVLLLTTILPILFQYCYKYLWAVMKAGGSSVHLDF
jgi:hypothetical protein